METQRGTPIPLPTNTSEPERTGADRGNTNNPCIM